jgi:hypothetical protein
MLLDAKDDLVAVIDWEFAYAAPTQFSLDPPWWLLLETPEMWSPDMNDWAQVYSTRLEAWLRCVEKVEAKSGLSVEWDEKRNKTGIPLSLSRYMRKSWETGRFWLNYAARGSWAFDTIFWKHLDERFFG